MKTNYYQTFAVVHLMTYIHVRFSSKKLGKYKSLVIQVYFFDELKLFVTYLDYIKNMLKKSK